ncbi:HIT domain-containing protein [Chloroflexota bacterium]
MERHSQNPFDILEREERIDGRRVIHDDDIFIVSTFAPVCPGEILVFPKEDIAHILQTTESNRRRITRSILGIFPALFFYRGITNLNIAVHMAAFTEMEQARKYYRWHMHIYPRRSKLPIEQGGSELGFSTWVIDTMPETIAEVLRCWYQNGPVEELVAKNGDGSPDPGLLQEFRRHVRNGG